jgi:signal transduction histidine kinase
MEAVRAGAQDYLIKGQIDGRLLVRALSYAIERQQQQEARRLDLQRIVALKDVNVALTASLNLSSVLQVLVESVGRLLPDYAMTVRLWSREHSVLVSVASLRYDDSQWNATADRPDHRAGFPEQVFTSKQPLLVSDVAKDARTHSPEFWRERGYGCYFGIPLLASDENLGVVNFYSMNGNDFSSQEVEFLGALASQVAAAIHNSQIHGAMKQLAADLERSNHVKEEFLGVISHELRTPINVVKGYVEMLQGGFFGPLNADQDDAVEKIANQTRVQLAMINSILNATTLDSEVATIHSDVVPLDDFFDDLQAAFPSRADGTLTFEWRYAVGLPDVRTDRAKLQYILQNLINNAIKFTPKGVISVAAEVSPAPAWDATQKGPLGHCLTLRVADTGIGIAEEFLPVIFEKFSRVDSSTTRAHEGIGLGLHIVKRCSDLLGGTVQVASEVGKGTSFTIKIPCELESQPFDPAAGVEAEL